MGQVHKIYEKKSKDHKVINLAKDLGHKMWLDVVDSLDLSNPFVHKASIRLLKLMKVEKSEVESPSIITKIENDESIHALKTVLVKVIQLKACALEIENMQKMYEMAEAEFETSKTVLNTTISAHEDVDPDDEWSISQAHIAVIEADEDEELGSLHIEFLKVAVMNSLRMASGEFDVWEIKNGEYPDEIKEQVGEQDGVAKYYRDLAVILTGKEREDSIALMKSACSSKDKALEIAKSEEAERPVRYFAETVARIFEHLD